MLTTVYFTHAKRIEQISSIVNHKSWAFVKKSIQRMAGVSTLRSNHNYKNNVVFKRLREQIETPI
jgi:hypothetical protein